METNSDCVFTAAEYKREFVPRESLPRGQHQQLTILWPETVERVTHMFLARRSQIGGVRWRGRAAMGPDSSLQLCVPLGFASTVPDLVAGSDIEPRTGLIAFRHRIELLPSNGKSGVEDVLRLLWCAEATKAISPDIARMQCIEITKLLLVWFHHVTTTAIALISRSRHEHARRKNRSTPRHTSPSPWVFHFFESEVQAGDEVRDRLHRLGLMSSTIGAGVVMRRSLDDV